jgi:hypothetical protein
MANEIKFIFTGDTAEFDAAINKVVKKTNEAKSATQKQTEQQKVQARLQKLLNEEYRRAAKNTGSILTLNEQIARTETQRLRLAKRLNDSSLTRQKRMQTIVELSKAEARLAGLTAARRSARGRAITRGAAGAGSAALGRAGLGGAASAGAAAAGVAGLAGVTSLTGIGLIVAGVVAAVASLIIAFKMLKGSVQAATDALALTKTAQLAGKTVEQVQAEQAAGMFGGDPEKNKTLFKELGLIVDKEIIQSLTKSGKVIVAFGKQIGNVLMPVFEKLAKVIREAIIIIGGTIKGLHAAMQPVIAFMKNNPLISATPVGMMIAMSRMNFGAIGPAMDAYRQQMEALMNLQFQGAAGEQGFGGRLRATDALARIGIFKGQKASEMQILKATLEAQRATAFNTGDVLLDTIRNA